MHALIVNNAVSAYPYTIGNLRRDNPQTSFPKKPNDQLLRSWGMERVAKVARPVDDYTKNIAEGTPILADGVWTQVWNVTDATVDQITERTEQAAQDVRSQRDEMLSESDWRVIKTQETGVALSQAWVDYRQALRDITDHENFPYLGEDDWPVKP